MTLSLQEERILRLKAQGMSIAEIAHLTSLSEQTVKNHLTNVYRKLEVTNAIGAMHRLGWIQIPGELPVSHYARCQFVGQCSRPFEHRGQHGGFRPI